MRYTVILEAEEDGDFHVWCPALKGCHSQGETQTEALENIRDAIVAYLESVQADGLPLPADVTIHHSLLRGFRALSLEAAPSRCGSGENIDRRSVAV